MQRYVTDIVGACGADAQVQAKLLLAQGRLVWCTEYLARWAGSTFETILPIGTRMNIGMFSLGFVDGGQVLDQSKLLH